MVKGAKTLVDVCAKVQPGEKVLVVTDMRKFPIGKIVTQVALERDAEVVLAIMKPRERAGLEPPSSIAEAMKQSDVIFLPVSYSVTHTNAVKNAISSGSRLIAMTEFTEEMMIGGGLEADFESLRAVCEAIAGYFEKGSMVRLTTPAGTDLTMNIEQRRGNAMFGIVKPGEFSPVPDVEANVSPVEGSACGKIIVDASIPYLGIGLIDQPIEIDVKDGFITNIKGSRQADILIRDLESQKDPNAYNIAELGLGLNPKCRMIGVMLEDEGVSNSAHIGIGTNITLGGLVKTTCHYDLIMWEPTVEIDGFVIKKGEKIFI